MKEDTFLDNPYSNRQGMNPRTVLVMLIVSYASFAVTAMTITPLIS
tara:strand:+ start:314 stop:451 length:138 start_codon:yes stop_codon:yes gene_type:complete